MVGLHLLSSGIKRGCGLVGLLGVCPKKEFVPGLSDLGSLGLGSSLGK